MAIKKDRRPKRKTSAKNKYLTRFDYGNTIGWQVRVPSQPGQYPTVYHSKFFADKMHGGNRKAMAAARDYRDKYLKDSGQENLLDASHIRSTIHRSHKNNSSGIIGVRRVVSNRNGNVSESWLAYGMLNRKNWKRSFSVQLYGEKKAFLMACDLRHEMHGPLSVLTNLKNLPCRPKVPFEKISKPD